MITVRAHRARRWPRRCWPPARPTSSPWAASCWPTPTCPNKLAEGRVDDMRPCIYQYRCIGNIFLNEPRALRRQRGAPADGDEPALPPAGTSAARAGRRRRPGGPRGAPGCCAARATQVVLAEAGAPTRWRAEPAARTDALLDRFRRLADPPGRADVGRAHARVRRDARALAAGLDVDEVVVATGGRWSRPTRPRPSCSRPTGSRPAGRGPGAVGRRSGGLARGRLVRRRRRRGRPRRRGARRRQDRPVVRRPLRPRGRSVTVLEPGDVLGARARPPGRFRLVHDTEQLGVRLVPPGHRRRPHRRDLGVGRGPGQGRRRPGPGGRSRS